MDKCLLTPELIAHFITNGYVVVPDVLTSEEVKNCRDSLHERMLQLGFDYTDMTAEKYKNMPRFGCQSEIFYPDFKFEIHEDPRFFHIMSQLFEATFAPGIEGFESPFSGFNPHQMYMYIDRMNCRLPDAVKVQGGLGLHVDCNPLLPHDDPGKWRPIQASVVLTDSMTPTSGGLYVVPGAHTSISSYVLEQTQAHQPYPYQSKGKQGKKNQKIKTNPNTNIKCSSFTRLNKCCDLTDRMVPVLAPAGSIILWDNRLPHATAEQHDGPDTREVLFMTYLPDIPRNQAYASAQRNCFFSRTPPPDFKTKANHRGEPQEEPTYTFSPLGKCLMAIEPWPQERRERSHSGEESNLKSNLN